MGKGNFGIIVSGGPAPGINAVICSVVIEACNRGYQIYGIKEGFRGVCEDGEAALQKLEIDLVSREIHLGGSIIGTSRFNPLRDEKALAKFFSILKKFEIDKVVIIGGEGSAYLTYHLARNNPAVQFVHVPKTIDNDIALPNNQPSFGFVTAKSAGTTILNTLNTDAHTERKRWFIVTTMGRRAGFLALSLGIASGSTLTLIPEEFTGRRASSGEVAEIIFHSIKKRYEAGRSFGVAVLAEGIIDHLDPDRSPELKNLPRDELGRVRYNLIEIGELISPLLRQMCTQAKIDVRITPKNLGYELRCHPPGAFDIEYTRFLGFGAVKYLLEGRSAITVLRDYDNLGFIELHSMADEHGNIRSRVVDLGSDLYTVARSYMIR